MPAKRGRNSARCSRAAVSRHPRAATGCAGRQCRRWLGRDRCWWWKVGAHGGHHADGFEARGEVLLDGRVEGVRAHTEFGVAGDDPDVPASNAQRDGILRDGGVRLVGGVDHQVAAGCRSRGSRDRPSRAPPRWRAGCSPRRCRRSRRRTRRAGPSTGASHPRLTCSSSVEAGEVFQVTGVGC